MAGGVPAGRLSIEIVAEIARLQQDLDKAKRMVGAASAEIARSAGAANDNIGRIGPTSRIAGHHLTNLGFQLNDVAQGFAMGQRPMQIFMQQGFQIGQIMGQAGIGVGGLVKQVGGMVLGLARAHPIIAGIVTVASVAASVLNGLKNSANESGQSMKDYAKSLGLTEKEMRALAKSTDLQVTFMDTLKATFQLAGEGIMGAIGPALDWIGAKTKPVFDAIGSAAKGAGNWIIGSFAGAFEVIRILWNNFPAVIGDLFYSAVNRAVEAINALIKRAVDGVNGFIRTANTVLAKVGWELPELSAPQIKGAENQFAGAGAKAGAAMSAAAAKAMGRDYLGEAGAAIKARADQIARDRIRQAALDKGFLDPEKGKKNRAGENLQKALDQLDAQIRGQEALAAAYLVSDAAAMRAEAHQKAEEAAIRHKADVALFYEKELALTVAKRAAEGAKTVADLRAQAEAQKKINDAIAAGTLDASQAAGALQLEKTLRPQIVALTNADASAKSMLLDIIEQLTKGQAALNAEVARGKALQEMAQNDDDIERMKLEVALLGASNRERAIAIAQLEAMQRAKALGLAPEDQAKYVKSAVDKATEQDILTTATNNYNASLTATSDLLTAIDQQAQALSTSLGSAFGSFGQGLGNAITSLTDFAVTRAQLDEERDKALKEAGELAEDRARVEILYAAKSKAAQMDAVGGVIGGLKSMFKQHSAGYKVMSAIEKVFAVIRIANMIKAMVTDTAATGASVANSMARGAADMAAGASKIFSQLGVWAFPVVAAMVALLVGLGLKGGKGGGSSVKPPTAEELQAAQGAGTVLGDPTAKSQSIANSLELMARNSTKGLDQGSAMVKHLRAIQGGIEALSANLARQLNVPGGTFDTAGLKLGSKGSGGFLGIGASSTTRTLFDQGVSFASATLGDAIANGLGGTAYQVVEQVKKKSGFFGIGGGTKTTYTTTSTTLDAEMQREVGQILGSIRDSVVAAAKVLGIDVAAALDTFRVEIGKISLKDLKGDDLTAAIQAVFSKVADQMAGFAVEGLEQYQKVGEGLFETLNRLAKDYLTIDAGLQSIGLTFGAVGAGSIAAREALIDLAGGLESFVDQVNYYYEHFLTPAEQQAFAQGQVSMALGALGLSGLQTIDQFKAVVNGLDLTTEAGRATYTTLMEIAPAFYAVATAGDQAAKVAADLVKQRTQMDIQLLQAQGKTAEALAKQREMELAGLDVSLRGLQQEIYAAQDLAKKKDDLVAAYKRESQELTQTATKFRGFADTLRSFRQSLFATGAGDPSYRSALVDLMKTGGLAAAGDEGALGTLQGVSSTFLGISRDNASSLQQYQRDVAMVARYVDQAVAGAEGQASIAEQQLATMRTQVDALVDIDEHVLTVAEAIAALNIGQSETANQQLQQEDERDAREEQRHADTMDLLGNVFTALEQNTLAANKIARFFVSADRNGALAVVTDADTPLQTETV